MLFGVLPYNKKISIQTIPLHFGRTLKGSEGGQSNPHNDIPKILRKLKKIQFNSSSCINRRGALLEANKIIADMRRGSVIHGIIIP